MSGANEGVKHFISSINEKFADGDYSFVDALEYITLVQEVEAHFNIDINDDVLNNIKTVQDLIEQVENI